MFMTLDVAWTWNDREEKLTRFAMQSEISLDPKFRKVCGGRRTHSHSPTSPAVLWELVPT